jgi:THO complex subunit 2
LCDALLKAGDWITAQQMIKKLPDQSVLVHEPIAKTLCQLIHVVIEPIYRLKCATPYNIKGRRVTPHKSKLAPPAVTTMAKLRIHAFPMLTALGPSLHYDPILLYKLIRLMRVVLTDMNADPMNPPKNGAENESLYYDCMTMLDSAVLPALSYMDCNCCIAEEIWSVIKFYPYQYRCVCEKQVTLESKINLPLCYYRYSLYARWKNDTFMMQPQLIRRRGIAQKQIKALMKRVSKENIKPVGRLIGKLSHCSPGFLFDYVS